MIGALVLEQLGRLLGFVAGAVGASVFAVDPGKEAVDADLVVSGSGHGHEGCRLAEGRGLVFGDEEGGDEGDAQAEIPGIAADALVEDLDGRGKGA